MDVKTLQSNSGKLSPDNNHCCIGKDNWIHPKVAKRLSCDASLVTVLEDEKGKVLNISRRSRIIPPSIKRALDIRDQGCRFPGCLCDRYVDAQGLPRLFGYHIQHWADGGETSLENLVTLCRYHHRKLHEGEFTVQPHPEIQDDFLFVDAQGREIEPTCSPTFPEQDDVSAEGRPAEILDIEHYRPDVSSETCKTKWMGDTMDEAWVVYLLMASENRARKTNSDGTAPPG